MYLEVTGILADIQWEASSFAWPVELPGLDLGCPSGHHQALREDSSWPLVMPDFSFVCIAFSECRGWPMRPGLSPRVTSSSFVLCQENANQLSRTHSYSLHSITGIYKGTLRLPDKVLFVYANYPLPTHPPLQKKNMVDLKKLNISFLRKNQCPVNK